MTWTIYSTYLHLRFNKGWKGKTLVRFSIIDFICVIFTFIGVNILLPGIHSYR
ncbi:cytochrome c biogenesis protein CcsA [Tissierella carlieri]|uniref:cytochrome c biogenesis protein CcsA n=1 Tax=Tissierella carlieri TaxID=689904 RepID=UPI001C105E93|nr:cytochrome c biogenesis protein CcsA [Tissierella carlieri]